MKRIRTYAYPGPAIISLIVGMFILLEGSRLTHGDFIDGALLIFGAALILGYLWLIGDYLERRLRSPPEVTLYPILLVLGFWTLYHAFRRPEITTAGLKLSLAIPGIVLFLVPAYMLWKAAMRKGL